MDDVPMGASRAAGEAPTNQGAGRRCERSRSRDDNDLERAAAPSLRARLEALDARSRQSMQTERPRTCVAKNVR